ncbi:thermonuclease family protein [Brevundimonas sp.]|uniref:thermonuclease family protein n=1 Tax=Brevundimonas sp. TaxID=1871086 RepID=UPI0025E89E66|nr:thermonuclease family protein [Brevundimonas sp.]
MFIDPIVIAGPAEVIDGDTLRIGAERIRLHGIDAPEIDQRCGETACGEVARYALSRMIGGETVACQGAERDRYRRLVAVCLVEGEDLGRWMVAQGWALAYRRYSSDYVAEEQEAEAAGLGLWSLEFVTPAEHRRADASSPPAPEQPPGCTIKGNINRDGERIYHLPGSPAYARTVIGTSEGERWFCSEEEARAAGWRAPL